MKELDVTLRTYVAARADRISEKESELVVTRALARPAPRGRWTRHSLNAAAAVVLSLALIAGGIVLETQLHALRFGAPAPSHGLLPSIPNEILELDNVSQGIELVTPFRLQDSKILPPRYRWTLPQNRALVVDNAGSCSTTVIRVIDQASHQDALAPVTLPDCYSMPVLLPGTQVLLAHRHNDGPQSLDLGIVAYDWSRGRVVRDYPDVSMGFASGLASSDGTLLYTLDQNSQTPGLEITNLKTGAIMAHPAVDVAQVGLNAGGIALSPDGKTVYVNEGTRIGTFDARTGVAGPVFDFKETRTSPIAALPGWLTSLLPSIGAEAKEDLDPGHGLAVDPRGHWVAALGIDEPTVQGIWVFDTSGSMRLIRHIDVPLSLNAGWRGIAASLDGTVLYALEAEAQQGSIDVIDPHTGQLKKLVDPRFSGGILGIAGVQANSP
jgi:DNA-binding beta-propeller fold protein YncE